MPRQPCAPLLPPLVVRSAARRLALVACLIAGLLSLSAGPADGEAARQARRQGVQEAGRPDLVRGPADPAPHRAQARHGQARDAPRHALRARSRCAAASWRRRSAAAQHAGHAPRPRPRPAGSPSSPAAPGASTPEPEPDTTAPLPAVEPLRRPGPLGRVLPPALEARGPRRATCASSSTTGLAEDPHDLHLFRTDGTGASYSFGELQSGEVEAKTLKLNAGTWRLLCALPEHAERGMSAKLRVVAG